MKDDKELDAESSRSTNKLLISSKKTMYMENNVGNNNQVQKNGLVRKSMAVMQDLKSKDARRKSTDWRFANELSNRIKTRKSSRFLTINIKNKYLKEMEEKKKAIKKNDMQREVFGKFLLYLVSNSFNVLTVLIYIIQTFVSNQVQSQVTIYKILGILELTFSFYFIIEFLIFLYIAKNKFNHLFSYDTLIDIITIFPSIVDYFTESQQNVNLTFLRVFRIFRVFRILRIYKTLRILQSETSSNDTPIFKINPIKFQIFNMGLLLFILLFIGAGICLGLQEFFTDAFNLKNMNFIDAFYYMIVTCLTLGYGDILPTHASSRILIVIIIVSLFFTFSDQIAKLSSLMILLGDGIKSYEGEGHIVVILDKTIQFENFLWELRLEPSNRNCDVLVLSPEKQTLKSNEPPYDKVLFMQVKQIDFETLEQINIINAKAVFIFCTKDILDCGVKEKITELILLQVNQFNISKEKIFIQSLYFDHKKDYNKKTLTEFLLKGLKSDNMDEEPNVKNPFKGTRILDGKNSKNILSSSFSIIPIAIIGLSFFFPLTLTFVKNSLILCKYIYLTM